jgi:Tol biopolymer transport system component/predicted Ser/Thr protein kinase
VIPPPIAHYKITAKLGEGGMGEVWRATDTKLNREVAIKIIPEVFARDADRMARFRREAQVLASLNHPNIAAIYGVEERALVMELVEGPTLAERIGQGAIPLDEALPIARQIADALEYAHDKGVIHRDLKPANIKFTPEGKVKVLDFGLAKALSSDAISGDPDASPTITMRATVAGVIMGTASYMAPEQAKGKPVDRRADIWAFGVVLVEMLTGRSMYSGETVSETLAAVMMKEPDVSALPPLPAGVRSVIARCLTKDPRQRLRDIGEARIALEERQLAAAETAAAPATPATLPAPAARRPLVWMIAAGALGLGLAALAYVHFREKPAELPGVRFSMMPPDKTVFTLSVAAPASAIVSPDGKRIVFSATSADGRSQLWVRSLDALTAQPLPGTEGGTAAFWSPDSRTVGFQAEGKLKKIDASGGPPLTLTDAPNLRGGSWSQEGVVVFAPAQNSTLMRVSAAGGAATEATKFDAARHESTHRFPWFLPDGRHFLFAAGGTGGDRQHVTVRVGSLDSQDSKVLLEADSNAIYSQGYVLFLRADTLMAQPFDAKKLALTGEAAPLAEHVQHVFTTPSTYYGLFSASASGLLAFESGPELSNIRLTWMDRNGKRLSTVGDPTNFGDLRLSPDQKSAAVAVTEGNNTDIWIYELARGLRTRFTFDPAAERQAAWSRDGRSIVFSSNRKGHYDLYRKNADGTGAEELLYADNLEKDPDAISPDGKFLLYTASGDPKNGDDIWVLPLAAGGKPYPLVQTPFNEADSRFSPDGRWVSYSSNESGRFEVYVIPFSPGGGATGGKRQVSVAGGGIARWSSDGKVLFYVGLDLRLMEAQVDGKGGSFEAGQVTPLFGGLGSLSYDIGTGGQRFLAVMPPEQSNDIQPLTVVQNWVAGLRK